MNGTICKICKRKNCSEPPKAWTHQTTVLAAIKLRPGISRRDLEAFTGLHTDVVRQAIFQLKHRKLMTELNRLAYPLTVIIPAPASTNV